MIKNTTSGSDENIDTISQLPDLILDIDSTIHGDNSEFVLMMLQFHHFVGDLKSQFSSWCENDGLNLSCSEKFLSS